MKEARRYGQKPTPQKPRPTPTPLLLGRLTQDLVYGGRALFEQFAAGNPSSIDAEDPLDDYPQEYCYSFSFLEEGKKLTNGTKVTLGWMGGRWYVLDALTCPQPIEE